MSILQFYTVMAAIAAIVVITLAVLLFIQNDKPGHSKEWKDLYMMVQDCNQRYEELKARVNNLEEERVRHSPLMGEKR